MASNSKQEYYRRIMKEKKSKSSSVKRINHPLARYNNLDQLSCVLCSVVVKSDILWQTHLQSKHHKEKVDELKSKATPQTTKSHIKSHNTKSSSNNVIPKTSTKRPAPDDHDDMHVSKKSKGSPEVESSNNTRVPDDFFDNNDSMGEKVSEPDSHSDSTPAPSNPPSSSTSNLPADFFDPPSQETTDDTEEETTQDETETNNKSKSNKTSKTDSDLPEGFFDDPKVDAKKRNVEFKDPQDTAWENFQKTISKETEVSEAIVEKGDEDMQDDRELVEVNEQVACYQKAENLRLKQEELRNKTSIKTEPSYSNDIQSPSLLIKVNTDIKDELSSADSSEELELDELLDWRFRT